MSKHVPRLLLQLFSSSPYFPSYSVKKGIPVVCNCSASRGPNMQRECGQLGGPLTQPMRMSINLHLTYTMVIALPYTAIDT